MPPKGKLNPEQRNEVCSMLARFHRPIEIINHFKKEYQISLNPSSIQFYINAPSIKPLVERLRTEYLSSLQEVPIAHKRVRLERFEGIYKIAMENGKLSVAKEALESARTELEGKSNVSITMNRIELLSDNELQERRARLLDEIKKTEAIECRTV